jgi:hypothetical protein
LQVTAYARSAIRARFHLASRLVTCVMPTP